MKHSKLILNADFAVGETDKRLFGSFIEHLGRAVYGGIYEPGHPAADEDGFREDVIALIKEADVPVVRYPGGNFVSGYNFRDGIGEKSLRPARLELAWETTEPNLFGTDEFAKWTKKAGTEGFMAVNLGTGSIDDARALVEYCNHKGGTYYSDLRRKNGSEEPHGFKLWCLGNEMDGPWQMGHTDARTYGFNANSASRIMKMVDPTIETVLCGSSNRGMSTFGKWEAETLDICYDTVDYVSLHTYFGDPHGDFANFFARNMEMDRFIEDVEATCDYVRACKKRGKKINLSFDEWNVWYHSNGAEFEKWSKAPHILEDVYNLADSLTVGLMMNSLLRHCDRVKIACLAQLVNVIAPIMTEDGGRAWRQTIYYPYMLVSRNGRGTVLSGILSGDKHDTKDFSDVSEVDTAAVLNDDKNLTVFAVNRNLTEDTLLSLELQKLDGFEAVSQTVITGSDPLAVNTADCEKVRPVTYTLPGGCEIKLPPMSWNMIKFEKR